MRPDPIEFLTGRLSSRPYPPGIGLPDTGAKFTTSGEVEIWKGNTFVSHVTRPSDAYDAMVELQERMKCGPYGALFTWLPAPSFHMTVFQGMSPGKQGSPDWPEGLSGEAGRDAITAELLARTNDIALPKLDVKATDLFCGKSLTITGVDDAAEAVLRDARLRLRDATRMQPKDFETYVFHVTLGYLIGWLSDRTASEVVAFSKEAFAQVEGRMQHIPLDPCAFCNFDSMHHFEPIRFLG